METMFLRKYPRTKINNTPYRNYKLSVRRRGSRNFRRGGGGPNLFRKKFDKQKKKIKIKKNKNIDKRGAGGRFSIYSALVLSKSTLAIEIAFKIILLKMTSWCFFPTNNTFDMVVLAFQNMLVMSQLGGFGGSSPRKFLV